MALDVTKALKKTCASSYILSNHGIVLFMSICWLLEHNKTSLLVINLANVLSWCYSLYVIIPLCACDVESPALFVSSKKF